MKKEPIRVLSVYLGDLSLNRGTPLRIKSLHDAMLKETDLILFSISTSRLETDSFKSLEFKNRSKILASREVQQVIRNENIDIVIYHTILSAYLLPVTKLLCPKVKHVLEMHGFFEEEEKSNGTVGKYKYLRNKVFYAVIYCLSDLITTCSDTATKKLMIFSNNVHTVYGGVDLEKFSPGRPVLNELGDKKKRGLVIGYSGNGRKWQGLEFLLETFQELYKIDSSFKLHLLLSEKVNFDFSAYPGTQVFEAVSHEKVADFNVSCDVLVIPRQDNSVNRLSFPSKLMEYLAMAIPVVGSKTSDVHKIITHNKNGLLYTPGNRADLIKCLLELRDPILRKNIGSAGYELVKNHYTWSKQGKLFANFIKNAI